MFNNNKRKTRNMMERDREDDEMEIINPYSSYSGSYNPYAITDYYGQKVHTIVRDVIFLTGNMHKILHRKKIDSLLNTL